MSTFLQNIGFATEGIKYFFKSERNGRIQAVIAFVVVAMSFYVGLSPLEWCLILGCIALVIALEMVNTALERVCAMLSPEFHPMVKIIKDVSAGAVLWAAIFCAIIGAIIFIPHLLLLFNNLTR
ncbi:MAG: diacylglycerol kinase family protein [Chitinophagaceae bacterium]|nr:diacylglycerol kinase family protein [Chitinophagaceae bacterium]